MTLQVSVVTDLPIDPAFGASYSFARLTRDKVTYGTHGLHKYPAKFIPQLPRWALQYDDTTPRNVVLDPFCGSGTTLVEAGLQGSRAIGIDISPLACLISRAKCTVPDINEAYVDHFIRDVTLRAQNEYKSFADTLANNIGQSCLGMHFTWSNWFEPGRLAKLLALKNAIQSASESSGIEDFSLAVLSSITKSCSYLNEDQIKVRFDAGKDLSDPFEAFSRQFESSISSQIRLSREYIRSGAIFEVQNGSASALDVKDSSVDRIITSPPYINAIDYTMAHKYNMFVLGLLLPDRFKDHCREYIGVTERAVRAADMQNFPECDHPAAREIVNQLLDIDTPTSRNRAYVVSQFFSEMTKALREGYRVLVDNGLYFLIVGETNRICGITVPTASILESIANTIGLTTEKHFFHVMANRSSMRLNRSETGGTIGREQVYVFRKY